MKINKLTFLSLPIDNTYENVFDWPITSINDYWCIKSLRDLLFGMYPFKELTLSETRAIKVLDGKSTITVPYDYYNIKDFNYVFAEDVGGEDVKGFFITGVVSQNDNFSKPSSTLSLEYDVWVNNYPKMYRGNVNTVGLVRERHIDRYAHGEYGNGFAFEQMELPANRCNPAVLTKPLFPYETNFTTTAGTALTNVTFSVPFWYVFVFNEKIDLPSTIAGYSEPDILSYAFFPAGALTETGLKNLLAYSKAFTNADVPLQRELLSNAIYTVNSERKLITSVDDLIVDDASTYVQFVGITCTPPFNYDVRNIDGRPDGNYPYSYWVDCDAPATIVKINGRNVTTVPMIISQYAAEFTTLFSSKNYLRDENAKTYNYDITITIDDIKENRYKCEIPYNYFPYSYDTAFFGGKQVNIIMPNTRASWEMIVRDIGLAMECRLTRKLANGTNTFEYFSHNKNFGVPFSVSKISEFYRDNGARYTVDNIKKAIGTFAEAGNKADKMISANTLSTNSAMKNAAVFAAKIGMQIMEHNALMADISRQKDDFYIPSQFDAANTRNLDYLYLYHKEFIKNADTELDLELTKRNGYILNADASVLTNYRAFFDYCRADNVPFTGVTNNYERATLKMIFENGVRKWHIGNFNNATHRKEELKRLDTAVLNVERWLISNNYISWED